MSFNTDPSYVSPCNRNNCRCGDSTNCMYYNSAGPGQSHYNFAAVQGAGSPDSPAYQCSSKAYDYYNQKVMYADHALGGMGTYAEEQGANQQDGRVDFRDESVYGKRDMCDKNFLDQPNYALPPHRPSGVAPGINKMLWLLIVAAIGYWLVTTGKINIRLDQRNVMILAGLIFLFFFFRW